MSAMCQALGALKWKKKVLANELTVWGKEGSPTDNSPLKGLCPNTPGACAAMNPAGFRPAS